MTNCTGRVFRCNILGYVTKNGLIRARETRASFFDLGAKPSCTKGGGEARALTSPVEQLDKPATLVLCAML